MDSGCCRSSAMIRQQGLFFTITLLMVFVISLLVLSMLKSVFFYLKVSHEVRHQHEIFHQLEEGLKHLVLEDIACTVSFMSPNQMVLQLMNRQGCKLRMNQESYEYLIDDLGVIPCLLMGKESSPMSSHHWLLSIATWTPHPSFIQVRVAKPAKPIFCASKDVRWIQEGVVSWRYLS